MGWTGIHTYGERLGALAFLKQNSDYYVGSSWGPNTIVDMATGPGGAYGVVEKTFPGGETMRFALIVLVQRGKNEMNYKALTEFDGPYETGMPSRLFDQLSPVEVICRLEPGTSAQHLENWRAAVRERLAKTKAKGRLAIGDVIEFRTPLTFRFGNNPVLVRQFIVRETGRRVRLEAQPDNRPPFPCRLGRRTWTDNPWHKTT